MENKQLDFNQPFLSVRRVSSIETSSSKANESRVRSDNRWPPVPVYNSDLKSGPVRNPGNVPFLWEHVPGRPKDGRKSLAIASKSPNSASPIRRPGTSSHSKQQHCSQGSTTTTTTGATTHKTTVKFRTLRERIERDLSSDSEDDDETTYLEPNDTLSRSQSFSMTCSATGLNGFDAGSDVKPSGSFSKDPQTRDFMMGRFLPAAKALASETPPQLAHHRKLSVQREQQREADTKRRVNSQLPTTLTSYRAPPNAHDEDVNLDEHQYSSTKACGLFTCFCLRGSSGLLHQVPGCFGSPAASTALRNAEKSLVGNHTVELQEENSAFGGQSNRKDAWNDPKKQCEFRSDVERVESSKGRGRIKFGELLLGNECSEIPVVVEKTVHVDFVDNTRSSEESKEIVHNNVEGETKRLSSTSMESCCCYYDANSNPKATTSLEVDHDLIQDDTELPKVRNDCRSDESERSKKSSSDDSFQDFVSFTSSDHDHASNLVEISRVAKGGNDSISSTSSRATARGRRINLETTRTPKTSSLLISSQLALPPPLPKSPSESWLKRTLSTISSRNSTTQSTTLAARIYVTGKNIVF